MNGPLVAVKGSSDGLAVSVGSAFPGAIAKLFPRWAARRDATRTISAGILEKLRAGATLSAHDVTFAEAVFGESEAKWVRRERIAARATALLPAAPDQPCADDPTQNEDESEADDWINKFWDDAGLVSSEVIQEIYARILAQRAGGSKSCSMRTLLCLRYLDPSIAREFEIVSALAVNTSFVPKDNNWLEQFGVSLDTILRLDEAGLVDSNPTLQWSPNIDPFFLRVQSRVVLVGGAKKPNIPIYNLREAGKELARALHPEPPPQYFQKLVEWLVARHNDSNVQWGEAPAPDWVGEVCQLKWHIVQRKSEPPSSG